jgi:hypothetical protein
MPFASITHQVFEFALADGMRHEFHPCALRQFNNLPNTASFQTLTETEKVVRYIMPARNPMNDAFPKQARDPSLLSRPEGKISTNDYAMRQDSSEDDIGREMHVLMAVHPRRGATVKVLELYSLGPPKCKKI